MNTQKLETRAKTEDSGDFGPWIKNIVNHSCIKWRGSNMKIHKWTSSSNHIVYKHVHDSDVFLQCTHGLLKDQRAWLEQGKRTS